MSADVSVPVRWRLAIRASQLGRTPKLVAVMLSTWMDAEGVCWPSRSTIARACSMTERGVDKALAELGAFVVIERTRGGDPAKSSNRYRATFPPANAVHGSGANAVHGSTPGGANGDLGGANSTTPSGEPRSPEVGVEVVQEEGLSAVKSAEIARRIRDSLAAGMSLADIADLIEDAA